MVKFHVEHLKRLILIAGMACFMAVPAFSVEQSQPIGPFGGLDTNDSPEAVPANQSPDMLNVNINPGGKSVLKRDGYAQDTAFTFSTSAVHGSYSFYDAAGNQVRLWGQDSRIWASVAGGTYVAVSTMTLGSTIQCTDYLGFAYCVTSSRDTPVKTNGTTLGTTFQGSIPAGTMVASTPERLLVGGTAANPQRFYYSAGSNFTDFTLGSQNSSSSYEDITAPGSQLTHIAFRFGRWLWWKDQSFGFMAGTNQFDLQLVTVSDTIGTFDNTDVFDSGLVYFRGTDNHFYIYDGSVLTRISKDITPTVTQANRRKSSSWTQTSQGDFGGGAVQTSTPTLSLSTAAIAGSIAPSTTSLVDTSSSDFNAGSYSNTIDTFTVPGALTLRNYLTETFSSGLGQFTASPASTFYPGTATTNGSGQMICSSINTTCFAITTNSLTISSDAVAQCDVGNNYASGGASGIAISSATKGAGYKAYIDGTQEIAWLTKVNDIYGGNPGSQEKMCFVSVSTKAVNTLAIVTYSTGSVSLVFNGSVVCSSTPIVALTTFSYVSAFTIEGDPAVEYVDNVYVAARSGSFASRVFDTQFSTPIYGALTNGFQDNISSSTYNFQYRCSSAPIGGFTGYFASSTSTAETGCSLKRYWNYLSSMTTLSANPLPQFSSATIPVTTTGTYYSAVNNASALTAWSNFGVTQSRTGAANIAYFTRTSTNPFTVQSSTPAWVSQPANGVVAASTGTYMQMRADFSVTSPTETARLDDFAFNWYEGQAADKMYGTYFDYAIWFAVSIGSSTSSNNRILRWDLLNQTWTYYSMPVNGFLTYNNSLYFGDSTAGKTYKFGGVTSDNNAAINAYWKTKDFFGDSPYNDKELTRISFFCKSSSGTQLTVTYTRDLSSATSYTVNLYDPLKGTIIHNRMLKAGQTAALFNVQFGDNSTNPAWQCFAGNVAFEPKPLIAYPKNQ